MILNVFKGILIGAGAILPGISSGVLCVIMGIYEKLLDSVLNFFKDIKNNVKYLFPIVLGGIIGIILFSNLLNYFFYQFPIQTKSIFIGLIIGTIPELIQEVNKKEKYNRKNIIYMIIAMIIGIVTVILENRLHISEVKNVNFIYIMICGIIMSLGIIVPGVSSTIILMLLGIYPIYLQSVANLYFPVLIPLGIGLILGSIVVMKITKKLLDSNYGKTFYCIIGFSIGSIFILLPTISNVNEFIISVLCFVLGNLLVKNLQRKE